MATTETTLLTLREVYRHFRISRATALRLIYSGKLKAAKIGRCWRISQEAVSELDREITRGLLLQEFEEPRPTRRTHTEEPELEPELEPETDPLPGEDRGGNWE